MEQEKEAKDSQYHSVSSTGNVETVNVDNVGSQNDVSHPSGKVNRSRGKHSNRGQIRGNSNAGRRSGRGRGGSERGRVSGRGRGAGRGSSGIARETEPHVKGEDENREEKSRLEKHDAENVEIKKIDNAANKGPASRKRPARKRPADAKPNPTPKGSVLNESNSIEIPQDIASKNLAGISNPTIEIKLSTNNSDDGTLSANHPKGKRKPKPKPKHQATSNDSASHSDSSAKNRETTQIKHNPQSKKIVQKDSEKTAQTKSKAARSQASTPNRVQSQISSSNDSPSRSGKKSRHIKYEEYLADDKVETGLRDKTLLKGVFRVNKNRRTVAYVTVEGYDRDIMIEDMRNQNRALHNDVVVISLIEKNKNEPASHNKEQDVEKLASSSGKEEEEPRLRGKVVAIAERNHAKEIIGRLQPISGPNTMFRSSDRYAMLVPNDKRFPKFYVALKPRSVAKWTDDLFQARTSEDVWPVSKNHPTGTITVDIGPAGDKKAEYDALMLQFDIFHTEKFPESCTKDLLPPNWVIPEEEIRKRRDMRDACMFSIDPATAMDLDDAMSVERVENGLFKVAVHIADVSFFVQRDSPLDIEAADRATTIYFVTKSIPMLPRILSESLCSLNTNTDKLAFTVEWLMNEHGEIIEDSKWIGKTVVRSRKQMSYSDAQNMIDNTYMLKEKDDPAIIARITKDVQDLNKMAVTMRAKRFENGSLSLDNNKLAFELNEKEDPVSTYIYERTASHFLIEEFMLQANKTVGEKIVETFPNGALLRRHEEPNPRKLQEFLDFCEANNITVDSSSSKSLNVSLKALSQTMDPVVWQGVVWLATKPMQTAKYTETNETEGTEAYHHYALNFDIYTHFTSPIRRYADLIVHRILSAAIERASTSPYLNSEIARICGHCNDKKTKADHAQDQCDLLFLNLLTKQKPLFADAMVMKVDDTGFVVFVPAYSVEKKIYYEDIEDQQNAQCVGGKKKVEIIWKAKDNASQSEKVEIVPLGKIRVAIVPSPRILIDVAVIPLSPSAANDPSSTTPLLVNPPVHPSLKIPSRSSLLD